jgi:hypothetical protein
VASFRIAEKFFRWRRELSAALGNFPGNLGTFSRAVKIVSAFWEAFPTI